MARAFLVKHLVTASTARQSKQHLKAQFHRTSALLSGQMSYTEQKAVLRQSVKQELRKLSVEVMTKESQAIAQHIVHSHFFQQAKTVGIYLHCVKLKEVDTTPIVSAAVQAGLGKHCFVPLVEDRHANMRLLHLDSLEGLVAVPPFNIYEPKPSYVTGLPRLDALLMDEPLELLLMPGLAFDRQGHRLGRGGGYYDNFIHKYKQRAEAKGWRPPLLVALAFDAQMVPFVPTARHDVNVDILVTAQELLACSSRGDTVLTAASLA
ncbi:hypothetical protein ABBQ38_005905 [Trebouxia sp. C0009 RCD-2024]